MRTTICLCAALLAAPLLSRADRVVLAPLGDTLDADSVKLDFAISPRPGNSNRSWIQFTTHEGVEFELERHELATDTKPRVAFNVQYPILTNFGALPAISVGVRDIFGTGLERDSLYVAATHVVALSGNQMRLLHSLQITAGAGSGAMKGPFAGISAKVAGGVEVYVEWFRSQPNVSVSVPIRWGLKGKAYSLNGDLYYGLGYTWTH